MISENRYFTWCVVVITVLFCATGWAADAREQELIDVLKSNAPKADKAITCKKLAVYGSAEAVPALAPLLEDSELTSWARIALEAIPGEAADAALRNALDKVEGRILVGVINSIGVRQDGKAVDALVAKLRGPDAAVVTAAAVALGHIGGDAAAKPLQEMLAKNPAVAEGCILCAEGYLDGGEQAKAMALYDAVRQAHVPGQRVLEATRGAILSRGAAGVPLLIEQLESADAEKVGIGLRTARELPGRDVTEAMAAELDRLDPARRPLLLMALADRHDEAVLPVILKAARPGPASLRLTAIGLLVRLGNVSCVPVLLDAATDADEELSLAARETLIRLPGEDVDGDLLKQLSQADGKKRQVLLVVAGQRQMDAARPAVVESLSDADAGIRGAAIEAIGIIGKDKQAADLVKLLPTAKDAEERQAMEKALLAISGRGGAACIPHLLPLTRSDDAQLHMIGLHAMAIIGGSDALASVTSALGAQDTTVQDEAVRVLSTWPNNWPQDAQAGQSLLTLATSAQKMSHKVLGLRGYLQYVRGNGQLSNDAKVANVKAVLDLAGRLEEKRLAIAVLGTAPTAGGLDLLATLAQDASVAEEVYSAMVNVTRGDVAGVSTDQRRSTLEKVLQQSTNDGTKRRAQDALRRIR